MQKESQLVNCILDNVLDNTDAYLFRYDRKEHAMHIPERTQKIFSCGSFYNNMPDSFARDAVYWFDYKNFCQMFQKIHAGEKSATTEFRDKSGLHWYHASLDLMQGEWDGEGDVLGIIKIMDQEKEWQELFESSLHLMKDRYYRIACIDLQTNSMRTVTIADDERMEATQFLENYREAILKFASEYVLPEFKEKFLAVMRLERLLDFFDNGSNYVDIVYERLESNKAVWVRSELIPMQGYGTDHKRVMWYVKNISEEKAMEDQLSQQLMQNNAEINLRLETILNGVRGGFVINYDDDKYSYKYVSEAAAAIQGYTVEEFMKASKGNALDNCFVTDREIVHKQIMEDYSKMDTHSVKYRVQAKDGKIKWVLDSGKRVIDRNGECLHYSLLQDVTEIERSNIKAKDTLNMLNQMVSALSCGVLAYTIPERRILIMNDEAKRIFGCSQEDAGMEIERLIGETVCGEDRGTIRSAVHMLENPGDDVTYVFRTSLKDGQMLKVQAYTRLLEFDDGGRYILSSVLDVTEQSQLTDLLEQERKQYRDALTANSIFSFSFDVTDGFVRQEYTSNDGVSTLRELSLPVPVEFNYFMEEWLKAEKPEFLNKNMVQLLKSETLLSHYNQGERQLEVEFYNPKTDRYTRVMFLMSQSDENGHVLAFVSGIDTTKERKVEQQAKQALTDAYEAANRASQAKSDFLSHMSHDIRTPMNAIIGMTAIAATHIDDKERVADCLNKVTSSSKHLLTLINEVLDMSKIESGKMELTEEEINLSELIDNLLVMVRPQLEEKNHELKVTIRNVEHENVVGDSLHIQQVFINIMGNAVKYTPENGKIFLTISEKVTNQPKVGCYEFIFEDNGIGMSPEFLEHIFEPFVREDESGNNKIQGTGLGLAITRNIIRMMGGDIKVESELGKGSKFIVTIYLKLRNVEEVNYEEFLDLPILVADDEEDSCEGTCMMLTELGMKSEWVLTGMEAVEKVKHAHKENQDYFAVILDWKMPGMDGIATAKEIRKTVGSEVPILILSAYDWSEIEMEARAAGVDAFISKPLFKSRLVYLFHGLVGGGIQSAEPQGKRVIEADFSGKRVLLVEDNELNAEIAQEVLEDTGLTVDHAWNGKEAIDTLLEAEKGYYQLVFMDIQMPVMNGYEAVRAIRSTGRKDLQKIPIVAMTANAFAEDVQAAINAGMNQHIAKPLDLDHLLVTLNKWL